MKMPLLLLAALAGGGLFLALNADDQAPASPHRLRRDRLRELVLKKEGGPALIVLRQGRAPREVFTPFKPDADFFYLTGSEAEGGALMLVARSGEPQRREVRDMLFMPACDKGAMQWTGYFPCSGEPDGKDPDDPAARTLRETGADAVREEGGLAAAIVSAARRLEIGAIYVAAEGSAPGEPLAANEWLARELRDRLPGLAFRDLNPLLTELRFVKDEREQGLIRRACAITSAAHRRIAKVLKGGMFEYELQGELEHEYLREGATGIAFPSIVASGPNGVVLHYESNRRKMEAGELVVVDIGSEFHHYASDLTRTYPVSGKFTARQRQIYNWVAQAQAEGFKFAKPGGSLTAMDKAARAFLKTKVCGDKPEMTCDKYFIHGIGHTVGLETHDRGYAQTLVPGAVVTNEPGIYIEHDPLAGGAPIGVRIEDTVLVTADGYENFSPSFHTAEEVESAMKR